MKLFEIGPDPEQNSDDDSGLGSPVGELNNTQLGILLNMKLAGSPELAHAELSQARNVVSGRDFLVDKGYITIDDSDEIPTAELTDKAEELMTANNLMDDEAIGSENGGLTDRGQKLKDMYDDMKDSWMTIE